MTSTTEKQENQDRQLQDPNTLRELVFNIPEGIYITTPSGAFVDANPALLELLGFENLDGLQQQTVAELCVDLDRWQEQHEQLDREGLVRDFELDIRRSDGMVRTVLDTCYLVRDPETDRRYLYGILIDITQRKEVERQLRRLLVRDPLTGCYNRRYLSDLEARFDPNGAALGAIVVDVDHFKRYNDEYGHAAGDAVLVKLARFLTRHARAEDAVIRIGGDEFLVVLLGDSVEATREIALRFSQQASRSAPIPISLGWAVRDPGEPIESTVRRADEGLIQVRLEERGRHRRRSRSGEL
ncbi:MAG: sensor domain-containing diguanylate cyclase [Gemmatimonadota bacterium]|nr:MAG: sensor domain-containing diguanylate cyclase [Gemmatimonadota bacterium]